MMSYYEAPNFAPRSLFLAGGITGCPDWQSEAVEKLRSYNVEFYNPRRKDFPIDNPDESEKQIYWERHHLEKADAILFWFPKETLCPITLFELGFWLGRKSKPIFVGYHKEYRRRMDVIIQCRLSGIQASDEFGNVLGKVREWAIYGF